ncbi:MmgE/PrpD family protein, partial [Pseudomonas sp. TNT11]
MSANVDQNNRPDYDQVLQDIADYVLNYRIDSPDALDTARNCLMDTLGCGLLALRFPECTKHLFPRHRSADEQTRLRRPRPLLPVVLPRHRPDGPANRRAARA